MIKNKKSIIASAVGNIFEWYDFIIYASLSPIISVLFFPQHDQYTALILTFSIFAIGYLTRPLGGLLFGHIGDKYGRRVALIIAIFLMSTPTLAIAVLPTYEHIGLYAPILLLIFRLMQGFAVGGEYPMLITYMTEMAPNNKRAFISSFSGVTTVLGVFVATLVTAIVSGLLTTEQMHLYGWRIPFLLAAVGMVFAFYFRMKVKESPIYQQAVQNNKLARTPLLDTFKQNGKAILWLVIFLICASVAYYTYNIFTATFLAIANFDHMTALQITLISHIMLIILIPIAGYYSDKYNRKIIAGIGILGFIVFSYPIYLLLLQQNIALLLFGQFIFAVLIALYIAPLPAIIAEQSITALRGSTSAISYNLGLTLFGGTTPMINMILIKWLDSNMAPAYYLIATGIISLISLWFLVDKTNQSLAD